MTAFEALIANQTRTSVAATLSRATDKIAEQMAREILSDKAFRRRMQDVVRRMFDKVLQDMQEEQS
jgi:hypothetical protein